MSKENKSSVIRITPREERLLKYIRVSEEYIIGQLKELSQKEDSQLYPALNILLSLLDERRFTDLDSLLSNGFIKQSECDLVISALIENKNILIYGKTSTGKTTLLNALLEYQGDVVMRIIEPYPEIFISESNIKNKELNTDITIVEKSVIGLDDINDLINTKGYKSKRLVLSDFIDPTNGLGLLTALNMGVSVLMTSHIGLAKSGICATETINEILDNHNFLLVEVGRDSMNNCKVLSITDSKNNIN